MTLTDEMRRALAQNGNKPVQIVDPQSNASYVLIPKDEYDRLRSILQAEALTVSETYPAQEAVAHRSGWDDPLMDEYDHYDEHRKENV